MSRCLCLYIATYPVSIIHRLVLSDVEEPIGSQRSRAVVGARAKTIRRSPLSQRHTALSMSSGKFCNGRISSRQLLHLRLWGNSADLQMQWLWARGRTVATFGVYDIYSLRREPFVLTSTERENSIKYGMVACVSARNLMRSTLFLAVVPGSPVHCSVE